MFSLHVVGRNLDFFFLGEGGGVILLYISLSVYHALLYDKRSFLYMTGFSVFSFFRWGRGGRGEKGGGRVLDFDFFEDRIRLIMSFI